MDSHVRGDDVGVEGLDLCRTGRVHDQRAGTTAPTQAWTTVAGGGTERGPVGVDGRAYVCTTEGSLYAIDAATGERRWQASLDGHPVGAPSVESKYLYTGTSEGTFHAFEVATGEREATVSMDAGFVAPPLITPNGWYLFLTDATIRNYRPGHDEAVIKAPGRAIGIAAAADEMVYVATGYGTIDESLTQPSILAIDETARSVAWQHTLPAVDGVETVVVAGELLLIVTDERVRALNRSTGERAWDLPLKLVTDTLDGGQTEILHQPRLAVDPDAGVGVVSCWAGQPVVAQFDLDTPTGFDGQWTHPAEDVTPSAREGVPNGSVSAPLVFENAIVVCGPGLQLHALDRASLSTQWTLQLPVDSDWPLATLSAVEDRIIIADNRGGIHAYQLTG